MDFTEPEVDEKILIFTIDAHLGKKTTLLKQLFVKMLLSVVKTVTRDGISLPEVLSALPVSSKCLFQEVQDVRQFFQELYVHVNWIKFDLLYTLTQQLSLLECNKQIQEYESELILYLQNRLSQIDHDKLPVYFQKVNNLRALDNNHTSFMIDVDYVWDKQLLEKTSDVPQVIAKRLSMDTSMLFLRPIQDSFVHLDFKMYPQLVSADVYYVLHPLTLRASRFDHGRHYCRFQAEERSQLKHFDYKAPCVMSEEHPVELSAPTLRQLQLTNTMTDDGDSTITLQHFKNQLNTIMDEEPLTVENGHRELMKALEQTNNHLFSKQPTYDRLTHVNTIDDSVGSNYQSSFRCILELNPIAT